LAGIYARQAVKSGWLGLVGYVLLSAWFVLIMGFSFVEAFILPRVAKSAPTLADAWMKMFNGGTSQLDLGVLPTLWTLSAPLLSAVASCSASPLSEPAYCRGAQPYSLHSGPR
jgi:hypothetical protein